MQYRNMANSRPFRIQRLLDLQRSRMCLGCQPGSACGVCEAQLQIGMPVPLC
jgi:hypothetical protein